MSIVVSEGSNDEKSQESKKKRADCGFKDRDCEFLSECLISEPIIALAA